MDLVADFCYLLPTAVIAEMLGVPVADRPLFKKWTDAILNARVNDAAFFATAVPSEAVARVDEAFGEMEAYFEQMLLERRQKPRADMMSDLLASALEGRSLSIEEAIAFCRVLLPMRPGPGWWQSMPGNRYRLLRPIKSTQGYAPLCEVIAAHIRITRGVHCSPEQVIITAGALGAFLEMYPETISPKRNRV